MKISYEIFFSVKIEHDYYVNEPCSDFELVPTKTCKIVLNNHQLIYKPTADGGVVLFKKNEKNAILNKIEKTVKFSFLLKLKNKLIDNFTRLYYPSEKLGRKFYYFNNLNSSGVIDTSINLAKSTDNKVGDKDTSWLVNPLLDLNLNNNFTKVDVSEIPPKSAKSVLKSYDSSGLVNLKVDFIKFSEPSPNQFLPLRKGKYLLEFAGVNPKTEHIYFDEDLWNEDFFGIIELTKDENSNYAGKVEHKLTFRAERWKYYLIDSTNKITLNAAEDTITNFTTNSAGQAGLSFEWIKEADIEKNSHEKNVFNALKSKNTGAKIFLFRSNQSIKKPAENIIKVNYSFDNGTTNTPLPTPKRDKSKLEVIQKI